MMIKYLTVLLVEKKTVIVIFHLLLMEEISTGDIAPGESVNITFDDMGFYRLYDPDYEWMKIVAYVFPSSDNLVFDDGENLGN